MVSCKALHDDSVAYQACLPCARTSSAHAAALLAQLWDAVDPPTMMLLCSSTACQERGGTCLQEVPANDRQPCNSRTIGHQTPVDSLAECMQACLPGAVDIDCDVGPVVQARPLQAAVVNLEAERAHKVQPHSCGCAGPGNGPCAKVLQLWPSHRAHAVTVAG